MHLDGPEAGLEAWTFTGHCDLATPPVAGITVWGRPITEATGTGLPTNRQTSLPEYMG